MSHVVKNWLLVRSVLAGKVKTVVIPGRIKALRLSQISSTGPGTGRRVCLLAPGETSICGFWRSFLTFCLQHCPPVSF